MSNAKCVLFERTALTVLLLSLCPYVRAQSPYGRAARQTIPFVADQQDELGDVWHTEIDVRLAELRAPRALCAAGGARADR